MNSYKILPTRCLCSSCGRTSNDKGVIWATEVECRDCAKMRWAKMSNNKIKQAQALEKEVSDLRSEIKDNKIKSLMMHLAKDFAVELNKQHWIVKKCILFFLGKAVSRSLIALIIETHRVIKDE